MVNQYQDMIMDQAMIKFHCGENDKTCGEKKRWHANNVGTRIVATQRWISLIHETVEGGYKDKVTKGKPKTYNLSLNLYKYPNYHHMDL